MKKIGEIMHNARLERGLTILRLEEVTKIKSSFIKAIEEQDWDKLPPFPTVLGFVKSIASALSLNENMAVAVLKRDYPPQKVSIVPKPDVANKFVWSPKMTFAVGIIAVFLALFGYLAFEYIHFISPPALTLESPKENQIVSGSSVSVFGTTEADAKIVANGQPVEVADDGKFSIDLSIAPNTDKITVTASSRSGKSTSVSRKIEVQNN